MAGSMGACVRALLQRLRRDDRRLVEDALKHVRGYEESGLAATAESLAGALGLSPPHAHALVADLERRGFVYAEGQAIRLTPEGDERAREVVRAHRLWERYLADEAGVRLEDLHALADRREHTLDRAAVDALEDRLVFPPTDPHGDVIPSAAPAPRVAMPLTACRPGDVVRIVHVEDDDPAILHSLVGAGVVPGARAEVTVVEPAKICLLLDGDEVRLPATAAGAATVEPAPPTARRLAPISILQPGETGTIAALTSRGLNRRRLLDLGLVPGTPITAERRAALGEPTAYRVRGTLLALRREQADQILIEEPVRPVTAKQVVEERT
jgi:DtxR family Mn-dependent transcriptional regulator